MKKDTTTVYKKHQRKFLNKEGLAAVESTVSVRAGTYVDHKTKKKRGYADFEATLQLSDCNRSVCLDFAAYDDDTFLERSKKLQELVDAVSTFSDNWHDGLDAYNKAKKDKLKLNQGLD